MKMKEGYNFGDIKELKGYFLYKGKKQKLELKDLNSEKVFSGILTPDVEPQVNFKIFVSGTYKGGLVEESANEQMETTNKLKVELISPSENGLLFFDIKEPKLLETNQN